MDMLRGHFTSYVEVYCDDLVLHFVSIYVMHGSEIGWMDSMVTLCGRLSSYGSSHLPCVTTRGLVAKSLLYLFGPYIFLGGFLVIYFGVM